MNKVALMSCMTPFRSHFVYPPPKHLFLHRERRLAFRSICKSQGGEKDGLEVGTGFAQVVLDPLTRACCPSVQGGPDGSARDKRRHRQRASHHIPLPCNPVVPTDPSIPLPGGRHNHLTNGRQIRTRNGTRGVSPVREAASCRCLS